MDKEVLPTGATSVDGSPARSAASASQGRKKPNITVTTRSLAETGRTKTDNNGDGRSGRPRRSTPIVPSQGEKVEPVQGVSPAPKEKRAKAAEDQAKARQEVAASAPVTASIGSVQPVQPVQPAPHAPPAPVISAAPPPAPSHPPRPAQPDTPSATKSDTAERFPFLSEGRALETTVGEAILQAAAALGVPEDAVAADTLLVRRNLRSGQQLRHYGNVVIIGDVNAGAEVIATGDIIVVGALRGLAHAGAVGNDDSIVAAYYLRPTQLRVANYIGRAPDQQERNYQGPEVARVRDGRVVVEPYRVLAGRDL